MKKILLTVSEYTGCPTITLAILNGKFGNHISGSLFFGCVRRSVQVNLLSQYIVSCRWCPSSKQFFFLKMINFRQICRKGKFLNKVGSKWSDNQKLLSVFGVILRHSVCIKFYWCFAESSSFFRIHVCLKIKTG